MTFHSPLLRAFTPKQLFRAGEKGVWYDPSDMSTLWQDSARTTAVTAVEQPVGCIDDKSGRGNHATQSTSASRPVLSARVNLLTKTEQFDDAAWTKFQASISANSVAAPDGATTADKIQEDTATNAHYVYGGGVDGRTTLSVSIKQAERSKAWLFIKDAATCIAYFDVSSGTVLSTAGTAAPTASIVSQGNGWYRCSITAPSSITSNPNVGFGPTTADGVISYAGTAGSGIYIWGADLRVSNDGVGLPAYQRVNTSTDYDTAGFPMYLRFDGTDDSLATGSVDFTGTDKMTVWAGVRKLSDASANVILETSNYVSGSGQFSIGSQVGAPAVDIAYTSKGSSTATFITASANGYKAPLTILVTGQSDISADICILRVNGSQAGSNTTDQGSGNYSNMSLTISGRVGNFIFNGRVYSILVRGASSTTGQITDTENWLNSRIRAY